MSVSANAEREEPTTARAPIKVPPPGRAKVLVAVGRVEALRFARHPAVLAGLGAAGVLVVSWNRDSAPRWWVADVGVGTALLFVGVATLLAGHLATGRARRDAMEALYASYPTSVARRTAGNLLALVAPVTLAAALEGVAVIWLDGHGAIGDPRAAVLGGGLALVAVLGAAGVALGAWAPKVWVGVFAGAVIGIVEVELVVPSYDQLVRLAPGTEWLFPWQQSEVLGELPGPMAGLPPAGAHLVELVGLVVLLGLAALLVTRPRGRCLLAGGIVACLAGTAVGWAGWSESRPFSLAALEGTVAATTHPSTVEHCATRASIKYCAYPDYLTWTRLWAPPVEGVLARLPHRPARRLVVRQIVDAYFPSSPAFTGLSEDDLVPGVAPATTRAKAVAHLSSLVNRFQTGLSTDPRFVPRSSTPPVYVGLTWGAGAALGPTELNLALVTAYWALGLPTTGVVVHAGGGTQTVSCLPVNQAREAVAVWLAASATQDTRAALLSEIAEPDIAGSAPYGNGQSTVATFAFGAPFFDNAQFVATTGRATLLAAVMTRLPVRRVEAVLSAQWSRWLDWRTSDSALATALGLRLPRAPATPSLAPSGINGADRVTMTTSSPASPVCH